MMRGMCVNVRERRSQLTKEEVLTFNSIHDILCDTALLVKSTYELQILFSVLSTFVYMTIWLYYGLCFLYGYYSADNNRVNVSHLATSGILLCLVHFAKLLSITISCHSFNNKMADTSIVLGKLLLAAHHDQGTMAELERFSHHIALRQFKFTTFGFLSLDLSLLVSMLGAVTTYLVILMQFKMAVNISPACCRNVTG
jgi:gustatory receptor